MASSSYRAGLLAGSAVKDLVPSSSLPCLSALLGLLAAGQTRRWRGDQHQQRWASSASAAPQDSAGPLTASVAQAAAAAALPAPNAAADKQGQRHASIPSASAAALGSRQRQQQPSQPLQHWWQQWHTLQAAPSLHGIRPATSGCSGRRCASSQADDLNLISVETGLARIDGVFDTGFIVSDIQVEGAVLCFGDFFALWDATSVEGITLDSLALVELVKPLPDLLVVGCGRRPRQLPAALVQALHDLGVRVDATDTASAASTFNILNQEGRKVVGALLPAGADGTED